MTHTFPDRSMGLLTDLYQLTMAYGYWKHGLAEREAVFHLFFRRNPFKGGYGVACGLERAMELSFGLTAELSPHPDEPTWRPEDRVPGGDAGASPLQDAWLGMRLASGGLADLGRHENYIERQLKRWRTQFEKAATREVPGVLETHEILASLVPVQQGAGIVHGDYRLDNCMMSPAGEVAAVLDWELCTLGDVLADVAGMVAYNDDRATGGNPPPTSVEGFPTSDAIREAYARHSSRDLAHLDFYIAFAYWRIACIVEGVYTRYAAGVMGDQNDPHLVTLFGQRVVDVAQIAHEAASRLPKAS